MKFKNLQIYLNLLCVQHNQVRIYFFSLLTQVGPIIKITTTKLISDTCHLERPCKFVRSHGIFYKQPHRRTRVMEKKKKKNIFD